MGGRQAMFSQSDSYPCGFFVCQFHRSRHIVSRSCGALNFSSFSASEGSAVKSGTSPRLRNRPIQIYRLRVRPPFPRSRKNGDDVPPSDDLVFEIVPRGLPHGLDDLKHAEATTPAQIVCLEARALRAVVEQRRLWRQSIEREEVPRGEIQDVQIVANAGAIAVIEAGQSEATFLSTQQMAHVRCWVVVAEHPQPIVFHTPDRHLRQQGQKVAWAPARIFPNQPGWVCACRA